MAGSSPWLYCRIGLLVNHTSHSRCANRFGNTSASTVRSSAAGCSRWRSSSQASMSCSGSRSSSSSLPGSQYEDTCRIAGPLSPRWVTSMALSKRALPQRAETCTDTPARSA